MKRPREWQKQETGLCLLLAAEDILIESGEDAVTMATVAARVGMAERTAYRHFRTREALLHALWARVMGAERYPKTADELVRRPRRRFPYWDKIRPFARSSVYSQAAIGARAAVSQRRRAWLSCVWGALPLLDWRAARRRAAIVELLSSPEAWDLMRQLWGLRGAEAGKAASEALEVLLGRRPAD